MGKRQHERGKYGRMAQEAVKLAFKEIQVSVASSEGGDQPREKYLSPIKLKTKGSKVNIKAEDSEANVLVPMEEFINAGYSETKDVKKMVGYQAANGNVVYLVKTSSKLNSIKLMVNPSFSIEMLRDLDGVDEVSDRHKFHSNMSGFPKCHNNGKTPTQYGWQVTLNSLTALQRFLKAFAQVRC